MQYKVQITRTVTFYDTLDVHVPDEWTTGQVRNYLTHERLDEAACTPVDPELIGDATQWTVRLVSAARDHLRDASDIHVDGTCSECEWEDEYDQPSKAELDAEHAYDVARGKV